MFRQQSINEILSPKLYYDSLTFSYLNDTIFSMKVCFFPLPVMNFMIKIWDIYRICSFDQNICGLRLKREKLKPKKTDSCPPRAVALCSNHGRFKASSAFPRAWYFITTLSAQLDQCLQGKCGDKCMINFKYLSLRPNLEQSWAGWWMSQRSLSVSASQMQWVWKYLMIEKNPHCSPSTSLNFPGQC